MESKEDIIVKVRCIDPEKNSDLRLPEYETSDASGMDVAAAIDKEIVIAPGERLLVPTALAVAIPQGYEIQLRPRSGLAIRFGITLVNCVGTIDADYRGEIKVGLINLGTEPYTLHRGDRIAQMVLVPVARFAWQCVPELDSTARGSGGFGHTGVR